MSKKCKRAADYATPLFIVPLSQFILNSFALLTQLELKLDIELKLNIKKWKVLTIPGFEETLPTLLVNGFWWFCYQNFFLNQNIESEPINNKWFGSPFSYPQQRFLQFITSETTSLKLKLSKINII